VTRRTRSCASGSSISTKGFRSGDTATSRWWSGRSAPDPEPAARRERPTCGRPSAGRSFRISGQYAVSCRHSRGGRRRPVMSANDLAQHYSRFRVGERLLLTGHSHQAWPDVSFAAQQRAWLDAAEIVAGLDVVARACERRGAALLVDAYHHLNVVPFDIRGLGLDRAFVTGGGYKYCQLGEGNAFLRVPPECGLRPVLTGWFSEFETLEEAHTGGRVAYGSGASRWAGATYDPASHYRAAAVFAFHTG